MASEFRKQLEAWLKTIDVKADRVLDVGGAQLPVKGRTKSWDVKDYKILDLETPHKLKVKPDFECDIQSDRSIDKAIPVEYAEEKPFDIVFCLEVAEYWIDPIQAIGNIRVHMVEGGLLIITFPFLYPHHNPNGQDCLRYTRWGVEKLMDQADFKISEIIPRIAKGNSLQEFYANEGMRASRDYDGHNEVGYIVVATK